MLLLLIIALWLIFNYGTINTVVYKPICRGVGDILVAWELE